MKRTQLFSLGTANLGSKYGITNKNELNLTESVKVIQMAFEGGIRNFDTAPEYGIAEELIGQLETPANNIKVFTKIPKLSEYSYQNILDSLKKSLMKLRVPTLAGIYFHDPKAHESPSLGEISKILIEMNLAEKVGFSAYSEHDILKAKERYPHWTLFQLPENIADRKKTRSKALLQLAHEGNDIHVRSIFLQGLLLLPPGQVDSRFPEIALFNSELNQSARKIGVLPIDMCLSYANRIPWKATTIVAAATKTQLDPILSYEDIDFDFDNLPEVSSKILDPRNWTKSK